MTIYFVRHGKTEANAGDAVSDDYPLSQTGKSQAREVARELKDIPFDAIISSPLRRALQTAEAINAYHKLPLIQDEHWRERELTAYLSLQEWNEAFDFNNTPLPKGVEPLTNFFQRVYEAIDDLKQEYGSKTVLIASHGGTHHALYAYVHKLPWQGNMRISSMAYCEYRIYEV